MDKLYICYASSDYYARETGISLLGFFDNNPDYEPDEVFILDYGILPDNRNKLDGIAARFGKRIEYLPAKSVLEDIQSRLNLSDFRGSLATYSRAFIDKIMPDYVNRLLYIDSDTVVVGSVKELDKIDMTNKCMAGVLIESLSTELSNGRLELYSGNKCYYGCGVVLFNLNNWREYDCYSKIVNMLEIKKEYPMADQTLINNAIPERFFTRLPRKYNYVSHCLFPKDELFVLRKEQWNTEDEVFEAINTPVVIHYNASPARRPWYEGCVSRRKEDYYKYKRLSPWSNDPLRVPEKTKGLIKRVGELLSGNTIQKAKPSILAMIKGFISKWLREFELLPKTPREGIE